MRSPGPHEDEQEPRTRETKSRVLPPSDQSDEPEDRANLDRTPVEDTQQRIARRVRQRLFEQPPTITRIGRFTVLEPIGHGGMGTVYAAYDGQLDRKVAVKVLSDQQMPDSQARMRFLREGQALARLSHPNVVTVHEVGDSDGELYLAMEFIRGQHLKDWVDTGPSRQEVLEAYIQAGRGLAAAHAEQLIHRDLKPHNIMRRDDGVVKVLDFGLARTTGNESVETFEVHEGSGANSGEASSSSSSSSSALGSSVTRTGMLIGTPAYMSPEQFRGQVADARSDQFSFCVALFEALYGERPFDGSTLTELKHSVSQGRVSAPTPKRRVPSWLYRVVMRGLSPEPAERWPSMAALLEALSRDPGRRRNRWLLGVATVGMLGLGGMTLEMWTHSGSQPCADAATHLVDVWDDTRRAEVEARLITIDRPYVDDVWAQVQRELDAYANEWVAMHTQTCEATAVRAEQSSRMLDVRMGCLYRATVQLQATVDTLTQADARVVQNAHKLVTSLPPLSRCTDLEALAAEVEPPLAPEVDAVQVVRMHLAHARSEQSAGRSDAAQAAVDAAEEALAGVEYGPVKTEVALQRGRVLSQQGMYEASEAALNEGLELAARWRQWDLMTDAVHQLMHRVGYDLRRMDEGLRYRSLAEGLSGDDPNKQAHTHNGLGKILEAQGKYEEAEAEYQEALSRWEQVFGPEHPNVTLVRENLATIFDAQGKYEEAEAELRATLSLKEKLLGSEHPDVAISRNNLGAVLDIQGRYEEAEQEHRAALSLREKALDPGHPHIASSRLNLANVLDSQGEYEEAQEQLRAALALWSEALGPTHPYMALAHTNLGASLSAQGKYEAAEAEFHRAMAVQREALGPEHPDRAFALEGLGRTLNDLGKQEEAVVKVRAALSLREKALGPDHPRVSSSRSRLAATLLMLDRPGDARPLAEQAWARRQGDDTPIGERARTAFILARARWAVEESGAERMRARALAQDALRSFEAAGESEDQSAEEVRRWLDSHRLP